MRHAFGKYGHIVDVTVPVNYHSGRPKGFAFVEFEDYRDAEDAIYYLNHTRLRGREITVEFTRGTRKSKQCIFVKAVVIIIKLNIPIFTKLP